MSAANLTPSSWSRLRAAFKDQVPSRDIRTRFGVSLQAQQYLRACETWEEAQAALERRRHTRAREGLR
ncbi:MAG: hypothetical protein RL139_1260 [Gemmatimonadota bacterium]|jgi:hypothetical protein